MNETPLAAKVETCPLTCISYKKGWSFNHGKTHKKAYIFLIRSARAGKRLQIKLPHEGWSNLGVVGFNWPPEFYRVKPVPYYSSIKEDTRASVVFTMPKARKYR